MLKHITSNYVEQNYNQFSTELWLNQLFCLFQKMATYNTSHSNCTSLLYSKISVWFFYSKFLFRSVPAAFFPLRNGVFGVLYNFNEEIIQTIPHIRLIPIERKLSVLCIIKVEFISVSSILIWQCFPLVVLLQNQNFFLTWNLLIVYVPGPFDF